MVVVVLVVTRADVRVVLVAHQTHLTLCRVIIISHSVQPRALVALNLLITPLTLLLVLLASADIKASLGFVARGALPVVVVVVTTVAALASLVLQVVHLGLTQPRFLLRVT